MADNPTPTANFDKNDYTFGKVGETKYIYINNDKFTITKDTSTSTGPVSNNNVFTKTFHCWRGSRGFYDNSFPYAERVNGENTSKILNGWYFNNWAGIGTDQTNDPSYNDAKKSKWGETNLKDWPLTANTWVSTDDANDIEPFCRFKFSIQEMLPNGLSLANIDVKKISGYILIQQENFNIANTYQVVRVLSRQTTDENGWYWQGTECLFYWAQSYSSSTDYPSETVNFEAHIIEGQKDLFIDIAARCPNSGYANMVGGGVENNSLRFEFVCQSIEYADKFDGNIYTSPNTDMVYISAAGTNITKFAALNNNVKRENNKVTLGSDVVLTTLKSGSTYITIDWHAGKIIDSSGSSKDFTINSSAKQEINSWLQIYSDVRAIEIIKNGLSTSSYTIEIENTRSSSTVVNSINYSLAEIQNEIKDVKEDKIKWQQILYRIGDVITTTDGTLNPATRYGGSWELLTSGVPSVLLKSYTEGTKWERFYSDGTLMQGNTFYAGKGHTDNIKQSFPFKFANTEYSLTATGSDVNKNEFKNNYKYNTNVTTTGIEIAWGPRTTSGIVFGLHEGYDNNAQWISYTAIGEFNPNDNQITKGLTLNKEVEYRWRKTDNVADGDGFSTPLTVKNVTYKVPETSLALGGIKWEMSCKEAEMRNKDFIPCDGRLINNIDGLLPEEKKALLEALYGSTNLPESYLNLETSRIPDGANNILIGTGNSIVSPGNTQRSGRWWYELYWGGKLVQGGNVSNIANVSSTSRDFDCDFMISYDNTDYTALITRVAQPFITDSCRSNMYIGKLYNNKLTCYIEDHYWHVINCQWSTVGMLSTSSTQIKDTRNASLALIPYIKVKATAVPSVEETTVIQ